jgi:hypothetical protein
MQGLLDRVPVPTWMKRTYAPLFGGDIDNFIPQVWSATILLALEKALVYAQPMIVNRDYEGDIQEQGDTVKINSIGRPTIFDYTKNTNMPDPETLEGSGRTLTITQSKGFNFQVDDIDKAQAKPEVMDTALSLAAYGLADIADQFVASKLLAGVTENTIGTVATPIIPKPEEGISGAYENMVDLGVKLDEQNVPADNRWIVVPPWFHGMLTKDHRFVSYAAIDVLYNRQVGEAAGFAVLSSNNVPTIPAPEGAENSKTRYAILAGSNMAGTYAEQINQVEAYRPEKKFSDAVKGLHLYGAEVERPEAISALYATRN